MRTLILRLHVVATTAGIATRYADQRRPPTGLRSGTIGLFLLLILFASFPAGATVISTFGTDVDGWSHEPGGDADTTVTWAATGGNPGGRLVLTDASQGNVDYIAAPAKFLGDDLTAYGTQLTFDISESLSVPSTPNAIGIFGDGLVLTHSIGPLIANTWDSVSLTLDETGGWTILNGAAPTAAQFRSVLGNVTKLLILGDFTTTTEVVSLDNFTMHVPEPRTNLLLFIGGAALVAMRTIRTRKLQLRKGTRK